MSFHAVVCSVVISVCPCVRLRPLDVEFMKALHEKVNIVPVLAKADTLTPTEVKTKKIKASAQAVQTCVYRPMMSPWTYFSVNPFRFERRSISMG